MLNSCNDDHPPVAYAVNDCPVCAVRAGRALPLLLVDDTWSPLDEVTPRELMNRLEDENGTAGVLELLQGKATLTAFVKELNEYLKPGFKVVGEEDA